MVSSLRKTLFLCGTVVLLMLTGPVPHLVAAAPQALTDEKQSSLFLEDERRTRQTLQLYKQLLLNDPDNFTALLHSGHLHLRLGWLYSTKSEKKTHFLQLLEAAEAALALQPDSFEAKLLHIVARAKCTPYFPQSRQVRLARELKRDLELFLRNSPDNPDALYILSWLHFKVSRISSFEKIVAELLYGGLPDGLTSEKALFFMEKAIALRPGYPVYVYDLALFFERLGKRQEARQLFAQIEQTAADDTPESYFYRKRAAAKLLELKPHSPALNSHEKSLSESSPFHSR